LKGACFIKGLTKFRPKSGKYKYLPKKNNIGIYILSGKFGFNLKKHAKVQIYLKLKTVILVLKKLNK
jgi:hypothetical protein